MSRRTTLPSSTPSKGSQGPPALPPGFHLIEDIQTGKVGLNRLVNVIGIVKDHRLPIQTKGKDFKCSMTLFDQSTQDENYGLDFHIFRPEAEMPHVGAGDIVVLFQAKAQNRNGQSSLLTSYTTDIYVYAARRIPEPPRSAFVALVEKGRKPRDELNTSVHEYVSWLNAIVDRELAPDTSEFHLRSTQSLNIKEKFGLLKDVSDGRFYDLVVQAVKEPYDLGDKMTLWVTDYTENPAFFNQTWDGADGMLGRDGDPYGYTTGMVNAASTQSKWPGPFGKRSMQVTCYEPHASFIRSQVKSSDWIRLRNVQMKYGRNGVNLEGYLRGDLRFPERVYVSILEMDDPETVDPRLKDAIRRKRDYEKDKKAQLKEIQSEVSGRRRAKRKAEGPPKENSKTRRKAKRVAVEQKEKEDETQDAGLSALNELIRCEHHDKRLSPVPSLLEPVFYTTTIEGVETRLQLPFTCANYRTNVRVIDFHPPRLEDFAVSRKVTEYDMISDNSGSSSDSEDYQDGTLDSYNGRRIWEWRFALKLEDASPKVKQHETFWAVVDNPDAQLLTGLDATDLRQNSKKLGALREMLFKLWGDLEERKALLLDKKRTASKQRQLNDRPALESSDHEDNGSGRGGVESGLSQASNKPFTCCIRQYGIRTWHSSLLEAESEAGGRWERSFGLFGTKICS